MATILVTGSTGFIGKRLIWKLLKEGHTVYALTRIKGTDLRIQDPHFHILYGDLGDPSSLQKFPKEIDAAYYLVHSLGVVTDNLVELEKAVAHHFLQAMEETVCQQIIFLSGIIETEESLSPHLQSRLLVEKVLRAGKIPVTVLRSSIIIGSGSASFEIIRDLCEKLPLMIAPRWVKNYCQPISISDVLFYLTSVLHRVECLNQVYDIGGPEAMTFKDVLIRYATYRKSKLYIFDVPVLTPRLSSYWLFIISRVPFPICWHLVESMKQNTRKSLGNIDQVLPHTCRTYEQSLEMAFQKIAQNEVVSTWMDSWDPKNAVDIQDFIEIPQDGCLYDIQKIPIKLPLEEVKERIWKIGGDTGWYCMDWAWRLRGLIDRMFGGSGLRRGRKHPSMLEVGEAVDFWRVILADEKKGRLILYAEMKMPGEAWLEFFVDEKKQELRQTATFRPQGFFGYLYWHSLLPFHLIIFKNMATAIAQKPLKK